MFGPPYQMDVTALGPGYDGRIRVHVGEQQNRHEVGWLLSVPRYGPLWGTDIFWRSRRSCLVAVLTRPLRDRPVGLVRSLLQIRQTLGTDVNVEVFDVDVVRRRGRRLRSPDCPG